MDKVGSSVSNRYTSRERDLDHKRIIESWNERTTHGRIPGTHTLGEAYKTAPAKHT